MGVEIPKTITERPDLRDDLQLYWEAYLDLSRDRALGFSLGPIPWTAINDWATRFDILDIEEFQILKNLVWDLDNSYLKYHEDKKKA